MVRPSNAGGRPLPDFGAATLGRHLILVAPLSMGLTYHITHGLTNKKFSFSNGPFTHSSKAKAVVRQVLGGTRWGPRGAVNRYEVLTAQAI
jgi:hypothetical protein